MKNILYIADPNSIHDIKWMTFFSCQDSYDCSLLVRREHADKCKVIDQFMELHDIEFLDSFSDFSVRRIWSTAKLYFQLRRWIVNKEIDIVHIMYAEPNALLALLLPKNVKKILTTRGSDVLITIPIFFNGLTLLQRLVALLYVEAFQKFDAITSTSSGQLTAVQELLKDNPKKAQIELVRTGVDFNHIEKSKSYTSEIGLEGKRYLFFPRNMRPVYNHEFAIHALELLPKEVKNTYHFVFINKDSSDVDYVSFITNIMQESNIENFVFLPSVSQMDVFSLYRNAELVVMTTKSDGSPVSAMETILCKTSLILPPLGYDDELFGEVAKFKDWEPRSLTILIENLLSMNNSKAIDSSYSKIHDLCNRDLEMKKIQALYHAI